MRYLKPISQFINEAIESKGITNTLSFINKNCPDNTAQDFLKDLRKLTDRYDYPMSKLNDMHIKYMSKKLALPLKNKEEIQNHYEIWCFKFWFSLEEGYLGYTSVTKDLFKYKSNRRSGESTLNSDELDILREAISNSHQLRTLTQIKDIDFDRSSFRPIVDESDYKSLRTGDVIAGYFSEYEDEDSFCWAIVYREDTERFYAIQNKSDGSSPSNPEWRNYGRYSWNIYLGGPSTDHCKLNLFIPGKKDTNLEKQDDEINPLDYNLPLKNGEVSRWSHSYNSINSAEDIEKADFSLVLYFDDMLNPDKAVFYEKPSDIRTSREESKEGALALKSDEEIRNENIKRYVEKLVGLLGLDSEKTEFKNLNKIILKCLIGKFSIMSILRKEYSNLDTFNDLLYGMLQQKTVEDRKYYFNSLVDQYEKLSKSSSKKIQEYLKSEKIFMSKIQDFDDEMKEMILEQYLKITELGQYITSFVTNTQFQTLEDLKIISYKLENLSIMIRNDKSFKLVERFHTLIYYFHENVEIEYQLERIRKSDLQENQSKLKNIERAIKSVLK